MSFFRTLIFVLLLMLIASVNCEDEDDSEGTTPIENSDQNNERPFVEESGNEINGEKETNPLKSDEHSTTLPDASDISMMSFDKCTTEGFSCFFPVVDEDDRKIETNKEKTISQIMLLSEVKQDKLAKYQNSSTIVITREGNDSMEIDITLGEDISQFMFTIVFRKKSVRLKGEKGDTSISLIPKRPFIFTSRRENENSWLRVTLLNREVRNPGNAMIMETQNREESDENGIVVKNINDRAKKTRKKLVSERDDTKEVTVEKEEKIQTRTLIIIISVSAIFVLFVIAVFIVGVVQCHLNKSRAKTKRTISATQSSSSVNENQSNVNASETHLIDPAKNESEGELIAKTASNSPFRSDTISESGHSELIPLARSVSAKSITHSRKKGVLSRRKSIGKEGKKNTPKTETRMKTIPLHQKRERIW